jgi:hypothetical protein
MNTLAAVTTGAGLGLVCYGSLWLGVRRLVGQVSNLPDRRQVGNLPHTGLGRAFRLGLVAVTFYALVREDPALVPAGLAGLWLARRWLLRQWGGTGRAD